MFCTGFAAVRAPKVWRERFQVVLLWDYIYHDQMTWSLVFASETTMFFMKTLAIMLLDHFMASQGTDSSSL